MNGCGLLTNLGASSLHPANDEARKQARACADYCKENGIELAKLAMGYCSQLKGPSMFLSGMPTTEILNVNLNLFCNGLTQKESDALRYCLNK